MAIFLWKSSENARACSRLQGAESRVLSWGNSFSRSDFSPSIAVVRSRNGRGQIGQCPVEVRCTGSLDQVLERHGHLLVIAAEMSI